MKNSLWSNFFKLEKDPIFKELKNCYLFQDLSNKEIEEIFELMHERNYKDQEIVFSPKDQGIGLYFIKEGSILIKKKETILAELYSGDFFGETAMFSEITRTALAISSQESRLLVLVKQDLLNHAQKKPQVAFKISVRLIEILNKRFLAYEQTENN